MILTLGSIFIIFLGLIFLAIYHFKEGYSEWDNGAIFAFVVGGACLVCCLLAIGFREPCADAHVKKFQAVQQTFDVARENKDISVIELAAIQQKAVEKNEELASLKFWAEHPLSNWFYSRKILSIKPIK